MENITALAEQIRNLDPAVLAALVKGPTPKVCANERCDREFVVQDPDRSRKQVRTKGVIYCSNKCARAQAQREFRRRNR